MRLLMVRHGQSESNVSGALDTAVPGLALTDLGHAQAEAAAKALTDRPVGEIFVSTLTRTQQTAAPLAAAKGLTPIVLPDLREVSAGDFEMKRDDEARGGYLHAVGSWILGDLDVRMPGGETGHEFLERYDAAIGQVVASGADLTVVVSHGAAIRTWVGLRAVEDDQDWSEVAFGPLSNTGCIELEQVDGGWRIIAWSNHPIGGDYLEDPTAADPTGQAPA